MKRHRPSAWGPSAHRWSCLLAEETRYFSPATSRRDQNARRGHHQKLELRDLSSSAGRGAWSGLERHSSKGRHDITWEAFPGHMLGSTPGGRSWGTFPDLLLRESLFLKDSHTGHREYHKAVYFPAYDRKHGCRVQRTTSRSPGECPGATHESDRLCLYQWVFLFQQNCSSPSKCSQGTVPCCFGVEFISPALYHWETNRIGKKYQMSHSIQSG